ncbi:MAG: ATP-binding protein [Ruminococcus sp.]|nr:ATP-binding protein [Ruminococcus sp.]
MRELTVSADKDRLDEVIAFVDGFLEELDCPVKIQMKLELAVEEIFVNIASYAYENGEGKVHITLDADKDRKAVTFVFKDSGIKYDPLSKADPDVSLSAEQRQIGGLGIFLTKKIADAIKYEYIDGSNVLTIEKSL